MVAREAESQIFTFENDQWEDDECYFGGEIGVNIMTSLQSQFQIIRH